MADFFALPPGFGPVSILVRLPFAAVASAAGGGDPLEYKLGVIPCVLALGAFAVALDRVLAAAGRSNAERVAVFLLCVLNPTIFPALDAAHPEDVLATAICGAAILAAWSGWPRATGLLLGLGVLTQQWAVLLAIPLLLVLPDRRRVAAAVAAAVVVVATLPYVLADGVATVTTAQARTAELPGEAASPLTVWWWLAGDDGNIPDVAGYAGRWIIGAAGIGLAVAFWRLQGSAPVRERALWLIALTLLLRCVLDPLNWGYYHAPFLLAVLLAEVLPRPGMPIVTVAATAATSSIALFSGGSGDLSAAIYLTWTLPLCAYLAVRAFEPVPLRAAR